MSGPVHRLVVVLALAAALAGVAGCNATMISGQAVAPPAATTQAPPSTTSSSAAPPPPPTSARPRELRLDGRDPCTLVEHKNLAPFHIVKPGRLGVNPTMKSPECFYLSSIGSVATVLVMTEGIEAWRPGNRPAASVDIPPIEDFPAITLTGFGEDRGCDIGVDVATGQYVFTTVIIDPWEPEFPQRCTIVRQWTTLTMNTLVAT